MKRISGITEGCGHQASEPEKSGRTGDRLQSWAKKGELQWFQLILEIDGSIWILTGQQQQVTKHPSVASEWEISRHFPTYPSLEGRSII